MTLGQNYTFNSATRLIEGPIPKSANDYAELYVLLLPLINKSDDREQIRLILRNSFGELSDSLISTIIKFLLDPATTTVDDVEQFQIDEEDRRKTLEIDRLRRENPEPGF